MNTLSAADLLIKVFDAQIKRKSDGKTGIYGGCIHFDKCLVKYRQLAFFAFNKVDGKTYGTTIDFEYPSDDLMNIGEQLEVEMQNKIKV